MIQILVAVVLWVSTALGSLLIGMDLGQKRFEARLLRDEQIAATATEAAASAAAKAIASIEVKNVTITQQLQKEVQTREVFRECRSGPDAARLLNATPGIAAPAVPDTASGGVVPQVATPRR